MHLPRPVLRSFGPLDVPFLCHHVLREQTRLGLPKQKATTISLVVVSLYDLENRKQWVDPTLGRLRPQ